MLVHNRSRKLGDRNLSKAHTIILLHRNYTAKVTELMLKDETKNQHKKADISDLNTPIFQSDSISAPCLAYSKLIFTVSLNESLINNFFLMLSGIKITDN
ncbi:hypothetical protein BpHYR1_030282 [Brachionus plicatilis]|uniref:Uncharacterized protein n=1 Tax=Brachionus plicatilis TaxID=10195 RepID=A0A3M7SPT6_BRAPC|nr:hypothetical protein BpHYR1_030282 [Brachionus plicatilis]